MHKCDFFNWTHAAEKAFQNIKRHITEASVLRLPDLEQPFEVACDASQVGIGGMLSQRNHPIAFFSEKLNEAKSCYSIYDLKFYVVVQSLRHWRYYLIHSKVVLYFNHDSLHHLYSKNISALSMHVGVITYNSLMELVTSLE